MTPQGILVKRLKCMNASTGNGKILTWYRIKEVAGYEILETYWVNKKDFDTFTRITKDNHEIMSLLYE